MPTNDLTGYLSVIPSALRADLLNSYETVVNRYSEGNWEPSELNGGKFSEAAFCVTKGALDGSFPNSVVKPRRFDQACKDLEQYPSTLPRSLRVGIPRVLVGLYEIRNNRNVGHLGGDVDPNFMDATMVLNTVKWVMAELIRVLHQVDTDEAARVVEQITVRETPVIWNVGGTQRILRQGLKQSTQILILAHQSPGASFLKDIANSMEVRPDNLKRTAKILHTKRLIEFNDKSGEIHLSPTGSKQAEDELRALQ